MAKGLTIEQQKEIVRKWRESPIVRHYSFSDKKLWGKQEEVLWAVRKHKRVAVKSCNSAGKSFVAADVVMDFLLTNHNSIVVTTAPTFHQVQTILWREIRSYCFNSKIPIGADPLQTELKFSDDWYAVGLSTDNPVNFQGKHAKSGKLLVVIDEASGITKEIWEMVEALKPSNVLAIGNPLESTGPFAECFQSDLWHKITISALDCIDWQDKNGRIPGLVDLEWMNEMAEMHGKNSPWYRSHVDAEFPEQDEFAIISREWVNRARKGLDADGLPIDDEHEDEEVRVIAIDLATKHGNNLTVMMYRYGHTIHTIRAYLQKTAMFSRDEAKSMYTSKEANIMVADADGLGESFSSIMSDVHIPCVDFHGGNGVKAIQETKFKNLRAQFYWLVAKKFEKGLYNLKHLDQKEFEILREQLCSIRAVMKDPLGRFQIESKEDMMARGIKSPDHADSLVLSEYGLYMNKFADMQPRAYGYL